MCCSAQIEGDYRKCVKAFGAHMDMLRAVGRPTLLLFDDVTVNSDNARLAGVKAAILDAATRHQILVMAFEADNWQDLGVRRRAMEDLRAA